MAASLVAKAKELDRFRYLNSSKTDKEQIAREIARQHDVREGLVCVLQCIEPCWTFDTAKIPDKSLIIRGERGKCSHLYHYYIHPQFGWMYVRLQTWFPFEFQIGINGREWLARQMDREHLKYTRSDNKILWVENWQRAQELLDQQQQTDWVKELNILQRQVHPTHPDLLGQMPLDYNWTVFQSEFATDVAFASAQVLEPVFDRWLRRVLQPELPVTWLEPETPPVVPEPELPVVLSSLTRRSCLSLNCRSCLSLNCLTCLTSRRSLCQRPR